MSQTFCERVKHNIQNTSYNKNCLQSCQHCYTFCENSKAYHGKRNLKKMNCLNTSLSLYHLKHNFFIRNQIPCTSSQYFYFLTYHLYTAWKVSKYGVFLVRIFPHTDWQHGLSVFSPNAGKYGPEKTPSFDFVAIWFLVIIKK